MVLAEKQIFLYVGPHKSGTFYLRDQIFPYVEDIYDVRTRDGYVIDHLLDATAENPLFLDTAALKQELDERLGSVDEAKIVISNPDFFGAYEQIFAGHPSIQHEFYNSGTMLYKTKQLSELFPHAKVLADPASPGHLDFESYYSSLVYKSTLKVSMEKKKSKHNISGQSNNELACDLASLDWSVYIAQLFQKILN